MPASLLLFDQTFNDANGNPLSSGKVWTYVAGTNTPKDTWSDFAQSSLNTNPVQLNAAGRATIFGEGGYKVVVMNSADVIQYTRDYIFPEVVPSSSFPSDTGFSTTDFGTLITKGSGTRVWSEQQDVLLTDFADIQINNPLFDNGPGLQAALDALAGTGKRILVPSGTFYLATTVTLRSDNTIVGGGSQCIFRAAAPTTMFALERSQNANRCGISGVKLYGASSTNPASIGIFFGPTSGSSNWTVEVKDIVFESDTFYTGITGVAELDGSVIENCRNLGGIFGFAFIDLQLASNAVAPSAGLTIRYNHCGHQTNIGFGKNRYGIRIQGGDCVVLAHNIINGFDVNLAVWSGVDGGRLNKPTLITNHLSEDFRTYITDYDTIARSTAYSVGQRRVTGNGFVYRCTTAGTTAMGAPAFSTTIDGTTADGSVVWTTQGLNSRRWSATTSFPAGYLVKATKGNANGWVFQSSGGTTGGTEPAWALSNIDYGDTFVDGSITWTAVHRSVCLEMRGTQSSNRVQMQTSVFGPVLVQTQMQGGYLSLLNCDSYSGAFAGAVSDIAFQYNDDEGLDAHFIATNSRMYGNFKPYDVSPSDNFYASAQLNNTKIIYDLLDLIDTTGEGIFSVYHGDYQFRRGGGPSVLGVVSLSPVTDTEVTLIGASTVTIQNTNATHKGKRLRILCLTSAGCTIALASGSFNFSGFTVPVIHLNMVDSYIELQSTTSGWEIVNSTNYVPGRIRQVLGSGVSGGAFTAGSFVAREFNEEIDPSVIITTSGASWTQFSLAPGVYQIRASAPAFNVGNHQLRLQNITAGTTLASGIACTTGAAVQSIVSVEHIFNITATTVLEVQHRCSITNGTDGFGIATSFGGEVFATCVVEKLI